MALVDAFDGRQIDGISDLPSRPGFLPPNGAVVFVDNHDIQRGHAGAGHILNYKSGRLYELANVFMLAWPYGHPMVMSSYKFDDSDQGPPDSHPIDAGTNECNDEWVCEHRIPAMANMVGFRNITAGEAVTYWHALNSVVISFGRGNKGHVIINIGDNRVSAQFATSMSPGNYCNIIAECDGEPVHVDSDGKLDISLEPMSAIAIHVGAPASQ
jgi:alpha-amylase